MKELFTDRRIERILHHPDDAVDWQVDLERFQRGDQTLTRKSAGESAIQAIQRLLIFLGYSTSSTGAFAIDGDFGRGTNRAVAQFQFEHGLTRSIDRTALCYACNFENASVNITTIPDARLTPATLTQMMTKAIESIEQGAVMCGNLDEALFHLDALHRGRMLTCKAIFEKYGALAKQAADGLSAAGVAIKPEWLLAIIRQETGGVVRPRFEQHVLTRLNGMRPKDDLAELRHRSMSVGLGQILGENYRKVGAPSARALYSSPIGEQVTHVARFLAGNAEVARVVSLNAPKDADFRIVARYYNGPKYEHHHYHESLARWFREFKQLASA